MRTSGFMAMSLDGFIAGKNDDLSWLDPFNVENLDYGYADFSKSCDALLMGRKTYEKVCEFPDWPFKDKRVFVCTKGALKKNEHGVEIQRGSMKDIFAQIASKGFRHLYVDGGQLISQSIQEKVLDDFTISIVPVILGEGTPLFTNLLSPAKLTLKESKHYPTGIVQNIYTLK